MGEGGLKGTGLGYPITRAQRMRMEPFLAGRDLYNSDHLLLTVTG